MPRFTVAAGHEHPHLGVFIGNYTKLLEQMGYNQAQVIAELDKIGGPFGAKQIKLERLRNDIQKGRDSGESAPLDMEDIKAEARKRRRLAQSKRRTRR